jgi:LemA protein
MANVGWLGLLIVVAIFVWAASTYNGLVRLRNEIANAFSQIDVQLKRRYDLIPNLVETAKKYLQHERETLQAVMAARHAASSAADALRSAPANANAATALGSAEQTLGGSLGKLMAVVEAYPALKGDQTIRDLQGDLATTENRIGFARQAYNDTVLEFNNAVGEFPALYIARTFGFAPAAMLQSTQSAVERQALVVQM